MKDITPYNVTENDYDECADPSGFTREEIRAIMEEIENDKTRSTL